MGRVKVAIEHESNDERVTIAVLQADVFLRPGDNRVTWLGDMDMASIAKHPMRGLRFLRQDASKNEDTQAVVVGQGSAQCAWLARTVREMRSPIEMESTLRDILRSVQ